MGLCPGNVGLYRGEGGVGLCNFKAGLNCNHMAGPTSGDQLANKNILAVKWS